MQIQRSNGHQVLDPLISKRSLTRALGLTTMSIRLSTYRTLSVLVLVSFVAVIVFATNARWLEAWATVVILLTIVAVQSLLFRCRYCGARPGLWLLAIWTLLLDYELYIADALFLKRCPRCDKPLS